MKKREVLEAGAGLGSLILIYGFLTRVLPTFQVPLENWIDQLAQVIKAVMR